MSPVIIAGIILCPVFPPKELIVKLTKITSVAGGGPVVQVNCGNFVIRQRELIAKVAESNRDDVIEAVKAARTAFDSGPWRKTSAVDRANSFSRWRGNSWPWPKAGRVGVTNFGKPAGGSGYSTLRCGELFFEFYGGLATNPWRNHASPGQFASVLLSGKRLESVARSIP